MLAATAFTWETRPEAAARPISTFAGMGTALRAPVFWGYSLAGGFGSACFFGFISGVPYLVIQVMERPAREYGLYFTTLAAAFMAGPNAQAGAVSGDAALVGTASGLFGFLQTMLAAVFAQAVGLLQDGTLVPLVVSVFVAGTGSLLAIAAVMLVSGRADAGVGSEAL